jgi:hypothetical protein
MDAKLEKYIATRDKRMKSPITTTPLREQFEELAKRGEVEVGGRTSCGGPVDPTWLFFTAWNEIVRKAAALGYRIEVTPVRHANKSPTMAGGYWNSNIYRLTA